MKIGHPPASRLAVDSSKAYDEAAHAAITFADDENHDIGEAAQVDREGRGWDIVRSKPRSNPKSRKKSRPRSKAKPRKKSRKNPRGVPETRSKPKTRRRKSRR
jgi:hypothetical protein